MPVADSAVRVSEAGIKRRLQKWGTHATAVIVVKCDRGSNGAIEVVRDAVAKANEAMADAQAPRVRGEQPFRAASGVMFLLVAEGWNDDAGGGLRSCAVRLNKEAGTARF